ncbi:MAG TPA: hypothetical protein VGO71_11460, partial [Baekduia sp.]|nr:hypothetical protein [Baekduia sp.]
MPKLKLPLPPIPQALKPPPKRPDEPKQTPLEVAAEAGSHAVGFALGPIFEKKDVKWQPVGASGDFTNAEYVPKVITETQGIGVVGQTT